MPKTAVLVHFGIGFDLLWTGFQTQIGAAQLIFAVPTDRITR